MNRRTRTLTACFHLLLLCGPLPWLEASDRPRLIVLTDRAGEPLDRLLLFADGFELEGLIATTSIKAPSLKSHPGFATAIERYVRAYPNLQIHAPGYPTPERLRKLTGRGSNGYGMAAVGAGRSSAGSKRIVAALRRRDPRPLHVAVWGGANTLAQALWDLKQNLSDEETARLVKRLRVHEAGGLDDAGAWACRTFANLRWFRARDNEAERTWLHLVPVGLGASENRWWGGWAGRYGRKPSANPSTAAPDRIDQKPYRPFAMWTEVQAKWTWKPAVQTEWAARKKWAAADRYDRANHPPKVIVRTRNGPLPDPIVTAAGHQIDLDASGSSDPDGDTLSYRWFYLKGAGTFTEDLPLQNDRTDHMRFATPGLEEPAEAHIILKVSDDGTPPMVRYRRIRVRIIPD
ncbi:MAG: DUF1593 domain-containing protein [Phycisphaeraceae bacterium]|nr:DUF1593 domain-containing protein [Phycisphaeraceae bacterium]